MKIKFQQLDDKTREGISIAVQHYAASLYPDLIEARKKYFDISQQIRHGELILGEYQYNKQEKGGQDEAGH